MTSGELSGVKLFFGGTRRSTRRIVEVYSFAFRRASGNCPSSKPDEMAHAVCTKELQRRFGKSIHSLCMSLRDLPQLPRHSRKLWVSLTFEDSDQTTQLPIPIGRGFYSLSSCNVDESDALRIGSFDTGPTSVTVAIARYEDKSQRDQRLRFSLHQMMQPSSIDASLSPTLPPSSARARLPPEAYGSYQHEVAGVHLSNTKGKHRTDGTKLSAVPVAQKKRKISDLDVEDDDFR